MRDWRDRYTIEQYVQIMTALPAARKRNNRLIAKLLYPIDAALNSEDFEIVWQLAIITYCCCRILESLLHIFGGFK